MKKAQSIKSKNKKGEGKDPLCWRSQTSGRAARSNVNASGRRVDGGAKGIWFEVASFSAMLFVCGCTGISIAPSCPNELEVGTSGVVAANVINPGANPNYQWSASPSDAGTFDDDGEPIARFTASKEGEVTISLTAGDGLYLVQSSCRIQVGIGSGTPTETNVSVSLSSNPAAPVAGDPVTVTCSSTGETAALSFAITRTAGLDVAIMPLGSRSIVFTPAEGGSVTIRCIGTAGDGSQSNPSTITLPIADSPDGGRPPR